MNKKQIKQILNQIKEEIRWYEIRKPIADAMIELGKIGFEFSGHGVGLAFQGEDFSISKEKKNCLINVDFCDMGKKCVATLTVTSYDYDDLYEYSGTIGQVLKKIKNKYH